jgi:hypothetical protein
MEVSTSADISDQAVDSAGDGEFVPPAPVPADKPKKKGTKRGASGGGDDEDEDGNKKKRNRKVSLTTNYFTINRASVADLPLVLRSN